MKRAYGLAGGDGQRWLLRGRVYSKAKAFTWLPASGASSWLVIEAPTASLPSGDREEETRVGSTPGSSVCF